MRARELGSGTPLGTSVMVTVVVNAGNIVVNVPGPVKAGLVEKPVSRKKFEPTPAKHKPEQKAENPPWDT